MRMFHHLRLWFFTFNDYLCRVVHAVTCCPIETWSAPSEAYYGEIDLQCRGLGLPFLIFLQILICLWWSWRESNPRLEHFSLYFIQQFFTVKKLPNPATQSTLQ